MTTLSKAPLIEVVVQFRWGTDASHEGRFTYEFPAEEQHRFPELFASVASSYGFNNELLVSKPLEDVPFAVSRRFRQSDGGWPAYQIGLGVFTINQGNLGYDWESYRTAVVHGFEILTRCLREIYGETIPFIGVELLYLDLFYLENGETPQEFLRNKLLVELKAPPGFLNPSLMKPVLTSAMLHLEFELLKPIGTLIFEVNHEDVSGRDGFMMDTRVRTIGPSIEYSTSGISEWLDEAHSVQRHAFETLIAPAYRKSLQ